MYGNLTDFVINIVIDTDLHYYKKVESVSCVYTSSIDENASECSMTLS